MRKNIVAAIVFLILVGFVSAVHSAEDFSATIKMFKGSPLVQKFFNNSYGYAVFPTIGKGGVGIGGAHGKGQVYQGGKVTGKTSMTQLTVGLQFGGPVGGREHGRGRGESLRAAGRFDGSRGGSPRRGKRGRR